MSLRTALKALYGTAWHVQGDNIIDGMTPAADGTVEANKPLVVDANKTLDTLTVTAFNQTTPSIGGVAVTTTAARLNALALADAQYSTAALQSTAMTGAQVAGATTVVFENTGTTPGNLQLPLATAIVAAMPGAQVGQAYMLKIRNSSSGANTATITTAGGITLHGTMTIAQNVTRDFVVVLTSLTAVDIYSVGISAAAV